MEVRFIPATKNKTKTELRVAAYARVSDAKDEMLNSLEAQIEYYTDYIGPHKGWNILKIFSDKGITGTKENRPGFQEMLEACRKKQVDMVITKAISRFARNTVTLLETVRELKYLGVDVYFEKEEIHTLSGNGEVMLSILASFAQAESLSVSENCKWRIRKGFSEGKINGLTMLGYKLNRDGTFSIVPKEAVVVKEIFDLYLGGKGKEAISNLLNEKGVKTRCSGAWSPSTVMYVLRNRKYTGELVLQLTLRKDYLSKKKIKNEGQLPMFKMEEHHKAIISRETFELVQKQITTRQTNGSKRTLSPFTGKILCADCGKKYKRKTVGGLSGHVWICSTYNLKGKAYCSKAKRIPEEILYAVTAEVLSIPQFDENAFKEKIVRIEVIEANTLKYFFIGGDERVMHWKDRSRRESWTEEMKEKARRKKYASASNSGKA